MESRHPISGRDLCVFASILFVLILNLFLSTTALADTPVVNDSQETLAPQGTKLPDEGTYVIRSAVSTTRVLEVAGGDRYDGANVQLWPSNMTAAQRWAITYDEAGLATLTNEGTGKVLDVTGANGSSGTNVQSWTGNGSTAQKWNIVANSDGSYTLVSSLKQSPALDEDGGIDVDGRNVQIWGSNGSRAQKWYLVKIPVSVRASTAVETSVIGDHVISSQVSGNPVLDIAGGSLSNSVSLHVWSSNGTIAQGFNISSAGDGFYYIRPLVSAKAIDVDCGNVVATTKVQQWDFEPGNANQKWSIQVNDDGTYTFLAASSGLALDVCGGSGSSGTQVWLHNPNGTAAQKWELDAYTPSIPTGLVEIEPTCALGKRVDISGGSASVGANCQSFSSNGTQAQKYMIASHDESSGMTYTIAAMNSGLYVADVGGNAQLSSDASSPESHWTISASWYGYVIRNEASGRVMDIAGAGGWDGVNLQTYAANGSAAQSFRFLSTSPLASGRYEISTKLGSVLDVSGWSRGNGGNVATWGASGGGNQKWWITDNGDGTYSIVNVNSQRALDDTNWGTSNGSNAQQWSKNGGTSQRWRLAATTDGWYTLSPICAENLRLDVAGANPSWGTNVDLWESNGSDAQKFHFNTTGEWWGNYRESRVVAEALRCDSYGLAGGICQGWVEYVYGACGESSADTDCAMQAWWNWGVSTDYEGIPVGATVYGRSFYGSHGWGSNGVYYDDYGHVGIYLPENRVASLLRDGSVHIESFDYWRDHYRLLGWGWQGGDHLE